MGSRSWTRRESSLGRDKHDTLARYCRACDVRFACNGGCPKDRFAPPPTANPPSTTCAPSLQAVDETLAAHTTLRVTRQRELRPHYARTLRLWRERFLDQWPHLHAQGFDETFRRMWEFYLAYSEAGFRSGYLGVSQLQLTREPA